MVDVTTSEGLRIDELEREVAKLRAQLASTPQQAQETSLPPQGASCLPEKYDDVLLPFLALMRRELHANSGKGDRPGWLAMDRKTAVLEIHHHLAKLQKAVLNDDGPGIAEYAADVANMAMMALDVCGGLELTASPAPAPQEPADDGKAAWDHATWSAEFLRLLQLHWEANVGAMERTRGAVIAHVNLLDNKASLGWKVRAYASPAPGELGAVDAAAWLPIETAPKDGAWVLVYWPTIPISLYPFCAFYDEGWQHPSFRDYGEVFPTHWMPLPQPPQQAPSESSGQ